MNQVKHRTTVLSAAMGLGFIIIAALSVRQVPGAIMLGVLVIP
ncbi:MAG: hypothetical protein ACJASY_000157 [Halioglobus sp.]|jgi:hypothetical protein